MGSVCAIGSDLSSVIFRTKINYGLDARSDVTGFHDSRCICSDAITASISHLSDASRQSRQGLSGARRLTRKRQVCRFDLRASHDAMDWEERATLDNLLCLNDESVIFPVTDIGVVFAEAHKVFETIFGFRSDGLGTGLSIGCSVIDAHTGRLLAGSGLSRRVIVAFELPTPDPSFVLDSHFDNCSHTPAQPRHS